jgi:hypothetical protein
MICLGFKEKLTNHKNLTSPKGCKALAVVFWLAIFIFFKKNKN